MANSFKSGFGYSAAGSGAGTPIAPVVKHYQVTIDTAAELTLEANMNGYVIPAGGAAITGDMGGTSPTAKLTFGGVDLMTAADPGAGVLESTVSAGVPVGTAAASSTVTITAGGTSPTGTLGVTVTYIPLCAAAKTAGVGV